MTNKRRCRYAITGIALSAITFLSSLYLLFDPKADGGLLIASLLVAGMSVWLAAVFYNLYQKATS